MTKKQPTPAAVPEMPPKVQASDLKWPETGTWATDKLREKGILDAHTLTFYYVAGGDINGWVIATLDISKGKRGNADRTYGITLEGKVCRVGNGPHVKKEVVVHLSTKNWDRLLPYVELYVKGLEQAGQIRDRISTRRAQGQINRANGLTSWRW